MPISEPDLIHIQALFLQGKAEEALERLVSLGEPTPLSLKAEYYVWMANCQIALDRLADAGWSLRLARGFDPDRKDLRIAEGVLELKRSMASLKAPASVVPDFDLAKVAEELTRERPLVKPGSSSDAASSIDLAAGTETDSVDDQLVSETLAAILLNQGKLVEAKKVYIQLARKDPRQFEQYHKKIEAIDNLLDG
jgi:hypothetical protein